MEVSGLRILGIDPGYATVGFGIVDYQGMNFKTVEYGAILTPADMEFSARLAQIYTDTVYILERYTPQVLSVEKLYFNTNKTTGIMVAEARGVILLACAQKNVPICEYTPLQVKSAVVGYGKAEKRQVMDMTRRILHLSEIPKPDDSADALALAICHGHCAKPDY
ncbi:MAG TPA: crossover junction endodeoxyribonuclease RuvC [Ruminococcus sp.]|nr:crossover junction endodeoxyribonuclease RuvC [Ruminococcus sp.]